VGQAQHGDRVYVLVQERRWGRLARVQVIETGLTGWVWSEYVVVPNDNRSGHSRAPFTVL
jgi:hypothetical protein